MTEVATKGLASEDFPGLYQAADEASREAQKQFLRASRLRLCSAVAAAVFGALTLTVDRSIDVAAALTAVALVIALLSDLWLLYQRPERTWYDGRALAESAKTLTWRYAMGASPFELSEDPKKSQERFLHEVATLVRDAPSTSIPAVSTGAISPALLATRELPLAQRKYIYLTGRVRDQITWYSSKSGWNRTRSVQWRTAILVAESVGVLAAILKAVGAVPIDLAGIVAAMIGASAAWLAVKQHESLARAYAYASNELSIIESRVEMVADEETWAQEVADAEEAVSREHTMWRASRSSQE